MHSASRDAAACVLTVPIPQDFASLHRRTAIADGTPHNMLYSGVNGFPNKEDDCTEVLESHECQESVQAGLKEEKIRGRELFSTCMFF